MIKGLIFVVSGPSGSGKTTLLARLLEDRVLKKVLVKSVSFTTRPKRSSERNAENYFFISGDQFKRERLAKKFLEWTKYLGYYYATSRDFFHKQIKKGKHVILCLDFAGASKLKKLYPENAVTIFIQPPSFKTLEQRIKSRCNKTKTIEIKKRLKLARQEVRVGPRYDYFLVNKDLASTVRALKKIVLKEINVKY